MEAKKDDVTRLPVSKRWKQDDYGNVLADCDTYKGAPIISLNPADMDDWQWERSHMAHAVECVNSHSALVAEVAFLRNELRKSGYLFADPYTLPPAARDGEVG